MKRISVRRVASVHRHRDGDDAGIRHTWLGDDAAMEHTALHQAHRYRFCRHHHHPCPCEHCPRGDRTRKNCISIKTGDGITLPAVLREPVGAPAATPGLSVHSRVRYQWCRGFGDIANAMASAGIVTLVPASATTTTPCCIATTRVLLANTGVRSTCCVAESAWTRQNRHLRRIRRHLDRHDSNLETARHCLCRTYIRTGVQWT